MPTGDERLSDEDVRQAKKYAHLGLDPHTCQRLADEVAKRRALDDERTKRADRAESRVAELEVALRTVLASAYPNKRDHPTMSEAWSKAQAVLGASSKPVVLSSIEPHRCEACGQNGAHAETCSVHSLLDSIDAVLDGGGP